MRLDQPPRQPNTGPVMRSLIDRVRSLRPRRRWVVLVGLVIFAVFAVRLGDVADPIWGYRVIDERTIDVQTITGPNTWTRVTSVDETATTVTVSVSTIRVPLPLAGYGDDLLWLRVVLREPLGNRQVFDGAGGPASLVDAASAGAGPRFGMPALPMPGQVLPAGANSGANDVRCPGSAPCGP